MHEACLPYVVGLTMVWGDAKEGEGKRVSFLCRNLMPTLSDEVFETLIKHMEPPPL